MKHIIKYSLLFLFFITSVHFSFASNISKGELEKQMKQGNVLSDAYLNMNSCTEVKDKYNTEFTSYKRSSCFINEGKYYYLICSLDNICEINYIDSIQSSSNMGGENIPYKDKLDIFLAKIFNMKESLGNVKFQTTLSQLEKQLITLGEKYSKNTTITSMIHYLQSGIQNMKTDSDIDDFLCEFMNNCKKDDVISVDIPPKLYCPQVGIAPCPDGQEIYQTSIIKDQNGCEIPQYACKQINANGETTTQIITKEKIHLPAKYNPAGIQTLIYAKDNSGQQMVPLGEFKGKAYLGLVMCAENATDKTNCLEWNALPFKDSEILSPYVREKLPITSRDDGEKNTQMLLASNFVPAQICSNLRYGGYDDWFLPAIEELTSLKYSQTRYTYSSTYTPALGLENYQIPGWGGSASYEKMSYLCVRKGDIDNSDIYISVSKDKVKENQKFDLSIIYQPISEESFSLCTIYLNDEKYQSYAAKVMNDIILIYGEPAVTGIGGPYGKKVSMSIPDAGEYTLQIKCHNDSKSKAMKITVEK